MLNIISYIIGYNRLVGGLRDGYWRSYRYFRKISEGKYVKGLREGLWREYYGIILVLVNYVGGIKEGLYEEYNNGVIISRGNYKNGLKEGYWYSYDFGRLVISDYFFNDVRNGSHERYNIRGDIIEIGSYRNGLQEGYWEELYENNKYEGYYSGGYKVGIWKTYVIDMDINGRYILYNGVRRYNYYLMEYNSIIFDSYELSNYEYSRLSCYIMGKVIVEGNIVYFIDDRCNFIIKVEDDYYYLCYSGLYKRCDQLGGLLLELNKTR